MCLGQRAEDLAPGHPARHGGGGVWAPGESPGEFRTKAKMLIGIHILQEPAEW